MANWSPNWIAWACAVAAHAQDDQGGHREDGWLVLDLPVQDIDRLARRFGQDGVLAWQRRTARAAADVSRRAGEAADMLWVRLGRLRRDRNADW